MAVPGGAGTRPQRVPEPSATVAVVRRLRRPNGAWILTCAVAGILALAPAAGARVLLVAGNTPELTLVELSTDAIVARIAMPGPVTGVATSASGRRGYAAAGNTIVEIDIDRRAETRRVVLAGAPVSALARARDGGVLALQGDRVTIADPSNLAPTNTIALGATGRQITAGRSIARAVVVLDGGRVAILALDEGRLLRTARARPRRATPALRSDHAPARPARRS